MANPRIVVVFDFDKTIIDCDSDNWIIDELRVDVGELHSKEKIIDDVVEVLKRTLIHPRIVAAIKAAHALGCDLKILSDANIFFIETILKHLGLREYFSEINTNPSDVDSEGRLRIFPRHDFHASSHGCNNLCPPNMCKGLVIERIKPEAEERNSIIIYLGDGSCDYCPSLKLADLDFVMPRKNFPLWDLICRNPRILKPEIQEWCDGEDLERVLLRLIDSILAEERTPVLPQLLSGDFRKLQTIPVAAGAEALPQALPVRH